ncbi:D-sedoheptulose-7-phosphate isomerase [Flavilitoribacter nigricans]|uniref:Phosphoheptose isomerase n=1 Tax=Flavilitoribacter nigricans (strain ATCC 23147 / DSM 23189 / NBRC 102662 / NCIMB 1420 / SS-2) TaxID=1122177 RepID=A0A2D0N958_FLAN2|nr:SIS domain-containing protein [Flavilitoribacter nigricans]PHN04918.1 phosphoheptose isomerase [Flavilitoribacter nigricans DSM 23189 = NBRC 102662]
MKDLIQKVINDSISVKQSILQDEQLLATVERIVDICTESLRARGKILFAGNGGSAADAQHLAAELSGRFYIDREPLFAEALHVNTSYVTAVANDYAYDEIYARLVRAMGQPGDVLFAISTSGNSSNIIKAVEAARKIGFTVVAMTGADGGKLLPLADHLINIPSKTTPRIQEGHMLLGHLICELIEEKMFGEAASAV